VASITTALGSGGLATGSPRHHADHGVIRRRHRLHESDGHRGGSRFHCRDTGKCRHRKGTTQQFAATGTYSDNSTQDLTATVTWTPTTSSIATVSNTRVPSARRPHSVPVALRSTASLGAITGTTILTVTPAALVSIAVTPANSSIAKGTTQQLTATGT